MNDFQVFDNFRVCAWMKEGLINAANDVAQVVKTTTARAGAVAMFAVAAGSATVSVGPTPLAEEHIAIVHAVAADRSTMHEGRAVLPSMDGELAQIRSKISDSLQNRSNISEANFDASTVEKAQQALDRINARMPVFSQEWLEQVSSGKA